MTHLEEQRKRIDAIDEQIVKLFRDRMDAAAEVARYKKEHGVKVLSKERERDVVYRAADAVGEELE
jgi:chorismate mutase/prephenate dehydratase